MYLAINFNTAQWINEFAFLMALLIVAVFYSEYKKCMAQIEKQEMLHQFLKD